MKRLEYYRRLGQALRSYKSHKTRLSYMPIRLWIEPTSVCNLACVMCPNKDLPKEQKGLMDFDLFRKIVDEAKDFVFDVHLLHRGESLAHPDFFRMVRYAHEAGLVTRFHTNGTLLTEDKAWNRDSTNSPSPSTASTPKITKKSESTPPSKKRSATSSVFLN
jgi:hypothetical protein